MVPKVAALPLYEQRKDIKAARLLLKCVLSFTQGLFEHRNTLTETAFDKAIDSGKRVLKKTQDDPDTRRVLSNCSDVWCDFTACFAMALPELRRQSFVPPDPTNARTPGSASALMAANHATLMKDLERLNDLMTVARNMLATTVKAQNLAAESHFDQEVLKLIDICVRVTARGYDGEAGGRTETQWANVVASYKKLLITCLQFLHNLVMHNEHRKLLLWLDLFGNSRSPHSNPPATFPSQEDVLNSKKPIEEDDNATGDSEQRFEPRVAHENRNTVAHDADKLAFEIPSMDDLNRALTALSENTNNAPEGSELATYVKKTLDVYVNETLGHLDKQRDIVPQQEGSSVNAISGTIKMGNEAVDWIWKYSPNASSKTDQLDKTRDIDRDILNKPEAAATMLEQAKEQLMARLQDSKDFKLHDEYVPAEDQQQGNDPDAPGSDIAADGSVEDDEGEDDEWHGPGDQERGLLTDIPLVLGPQEIEALPMIIQAGIVSSNRIYASPAEAQEIKNLQAVRCNILLAQESGRNLLRELLIFIAAWDLQDDEFYFKLMMQIMEAILQNGLMPFAYQTFSEVKDIVSPAQSIVIKILTQIFRKKQMLPQTGSQPTVAAPSPRREPPSRVDVLVVRYIFTVFRQSIIPETCALIYLQGQIRNGVALPEDFPLNLWDMERVYEGVYQFLEFFAVLTESDNWKDQLVKWVIVSELITLLRELDTSIPRATLTSGQPAPTTTAPTENVGTENAAAPGNSQNATPLPVAVERPYDPVAVDGTFPPNWDATASAPDSPSQGLDNQDPAEFEWRNLKKLVVLVLSSLVWKAPEVQRQIRQFGGVELILSCCKYDGNNPYIREHAIMCLRFLLEGCPENQEIVHRLEARKTIPSEVLDNQGYESFIDDSGKVGLRKKDGSHVAALQSQ